MDRLLSGLLLSFWDYLKGVLDRSVYVTHVSILCAMHAQFLMDYLVANNAWKSK